MAGVPGGVGRPQVPDAPHDAAAGLSSALARVGLAAYALPMGDGPLARTRGAVARGESESVIDVRGER
jgi:hypothetical protein